MGESFPVCSCIRIVPVLVDVSCNLVVKGRLYQLWYINILQLLLSNATIAMEQKRNLIRMQVAVIPSRTAVDQRIHA